jgi:hypothetical protein
MQPKILLFGAMFLLGNPLIAQQSAADFVGTWELVSIEGKSDSGDWVPVAFPANGKPVGIIMYDDKGNMAVQITSEPRAVESPVDTPEIVNGYVAYYAKYEVDTRAGTVTHHRRHHINPDLGQLSVVRHFKFSGDTLTLTVAPERTLRLNWARVR